ncbi:DUF484 family protein [Aestuariibacter halophilus]|uniref:DUF484 family protein n=1 Tax=Fluctibacter halophilus TaxID=226011 RepID=A0ABS8GEG8_9ALTE|nr:DUF484 family protein [Aestuariibacter halophilus]MCC2617611.1 DUF484 family protein [Aestuariibacter halophilus]
MNEVSGQSCAKAPLTELDSVAAVSDADVVAYLQANPDFFIQHPDILEQLQIPHQQKGSVSLVELQSEQLRAKSRQLSIKLNQLIDIAKQNEAIYRVYADLNMRLLKCRYFSEVTDVLRDAMINQLKLASVTLRAFSGANALPEIQRKLFIEKRFKKECFFFGRLSQHEKQLLFGVQPAESAALMLLGDKGELGILAVGSRDPSHFNPDMDTLLISQLQQFLNILLPKLAGY